MGVPDDAGTNVMVPDGASYVATLMTNSQHLKRIVRPFPNWFIFKNLLNISRRDCQNGSDINQFKSIQIS